MAQRLTHLLPDGTTTRSAAKYVKTWRTLGSKVERIFGLHCYAFDPGLLFRSTEPTLGGRLDLTTEQALRLAALVDRCDAAGVQVEPVDLPKG